MKKHVTMRPKTLDDLVLNGDLHYHSVMSDGQLVLTEILNALSSPADERHDISALKSRLEHHYGISTANIASGSILVTALTDHDTGKGIKPLLHLLLNSDNPLVRRLYLMAGTAEIDCKEDVEIISYGSDFDNPESEGFFGELRGSRVQTISAIMDRLEEKKIIRYPFSPEQRHEILDTHFSPGRNHLAQKLIQWGIAESKAEVFGLYLGSDCPPETNCYVRRKKPSAEDVIRFISARGGRKILAHPGNISNKKGFSTVEEDRRYLRRLINDFVDMGIDGFEGFYPYEPERFARYRLGLKFKELSNEQKQDVYKQMINFGLWLITDIVPDIRKRKSYFCVTGGSDTHFQLNPNQFIGAVRVPLTVPKIEYLCGCHAHHFKTYLEWLVDDLKRPLDN